ncbi:MAG: hemolysin family protein [Phycisphaerales bacterium]|nr:hemolysin family protein [Phycisphaerales bacterium]
MSGWWLWIALANVAAGGVFATLGLSLRRASRTQIESIASQSKSKGARKRVEKIGQDMDGHAVAVVLPRVVANLAAGFALLLWIIGQRGPEALGPVEFGVALVVAGAIIWFVGHVLPHSVGKHAGERVVVSWSIVIRAAYLVTFPFRGVNRFLDEVVRRLAGADADGDDFLEEELLSVVEEGERGGQIDEAEREMIEAVVEFRSTTVEQIMTPRTEMEAMEYTDELSRVQSFVRESGHSRIPVCREGLDQIVGVLYAKDLLHWLTGPMYSGERFELSKILRPAVFVPETKTVRELLAELLANRVHLAMVADEYGGTAGLVTIEDIVEEVFGEIRDEYETEEDDAPEISLGEEGGSLVADARAYIDDVNDALEAMGVEIPESEEYDTLGGFVTVALGHIPAVGEVFESGRIRVTVLEAEATRVTRVRLDIAREESQGDSVGAAASEGPAGDANAK